MENSNVTSLVDRRLNVIRQSGQPGVAISPPSGAPKPKLLDRVRQAIRTRHYSSKTEEAYVGWIRRFIVFHNKRHPSEMGEGEIGQFLSSLARDSHVSASTQNQALNALLFPRSPLPLAPVPERPRPRYNPRMSHAERGLVQLVLSAMLDARRIKA